MLTSHPREEIPDLLDGRSSAERAEALLAHLAGCELCGNEFKALRLVKVGLGRLHDAPAPADLLPSLARVLDEEDERRRSARRGSAPGRGAIAAVAAGVLLLLSGVVGLLLRSSSTDLTVEVARSFPDLRPRGGRELNLTVATSDPAELERFFRRAGIAFPTRVFDLGMMGYHLVGGSTRTLDGRPTAVFVYESENGVIVQCAMYEGALGELLPAGDVRTSAGIRFQVYRRDGLTLVFWEEGSVVCVLVSDIDPEDVVQLAIAKAMLPAGVGAAP